MIFFSPTDNNSKIQKKACSWQTKRRLKDQNTYEFDFAKGRNTYEFDFAKCSNTYEFDFAKDRNTYAFDFAKDRNTYEFVFLKDYFRDALFHR